MGEVTELRNWAELLPDALGLIFSHLCFEERLTVVSRVCKSWNHVILGPYCWQTINLIDWSYRSNPNHIDPMIHLLVPRSSGILREVNVSCIQNDLTFVFLANYAQSLRSLQIPRCNITDSIMEQVAERFSGVTSMDLSYCCKIGPRGLTAIGKNCKSLVGLRRNMHPMDVKEQRRQDMEAETIAATMPRLQHLEMAYNCVYTESVVKIIESCPELELLDVRGCWDVDLNPNWVQKWAPRIKVLGPHVEDRFEVDNWLSDSDYSYESSDDDVWDDDFSQLDASSFEISFYDGWPLSP